MLDYIGCHFFFLITILKIFKTTKAQRITDETDGGILVITGVFGMSGDLGKLKEITAFARIAFCLFVDDAHGFELWEKQDMVQENT